MKQTKNYFLQKKKWYKLYHIMQRMVDGQEPVQIGSAIYYEKCGWAIFDADKKCIADVKDEKNILTVFLLRRNCPLKPIVRRCPSCNQIIT